MSFQLSGNKPASQIGAEFSSPCGVWWALWCYVRAACKEALTEEEWDRGRYNDYLVISQEQAAAIANTLKNFLEIGHTAEWKADRDAYYDNLQDENAKRLFTVEGVKGFVDFAAASGGFSIS